MLTVYYQDNDNEENKILSFDNKDEFEVFLFNNQHYFPKIFKSYDYSINKILNILSVGFLIFIISKYPQIIEKNYNYHTDVFFNNNISQNIIKMSKTFERFDTVFSKSVMVNFSTLEDFLKYRLLNGYFISQNYFEDFNSGSLFEFCIEKKSIEILDFLLKNNRLVKEQVKRLLILGFFNDIDSLLFIFKNYNSTDFLEFYFNNFEIPSTLKKFFEDYYSKDKIRELFYQSNLIKKKMFENKYNNMELKQQSKVNF